MSDAYADPFRDISGLQAQRIDQGVDFIGSGSVYAIGPAVVETVYAQGQPSGWPGPHNGSGGYVGYRFTSGPAAGLRVYIAENIIPLVSQGQVVDSSTAICTLVDAEPACEIGWASGAGTQTAYAGCGNVWTKADDDSNSFTTMGDNFNQFLISIGARSGNHDGPGPIGSLCQGYPASWPKKRPPPPPPPPPPPENNAMSITVADFKNPGTPAGRTRFTRLTIPPKGQPFTLQSYNGAKIVGHGTATVTQASSGLVLGVEADPDGVHFVVTADDGGTFNYAFEA